MEMAPKERIEPTISDLIQKSEVLEVAGAEPVVLDESEGARAYRESVEAIVHKAHVNMDKIEQEGLDNIAISARAIKPEEGTPYDSFGDPLDLNVAADMRLAQIALQDEEVSKKFMERLVKRIGPKNAATITPLAMSNPSLLLTPENVSDVKEIAPRYWTPEYQDLFEHVGQSLLQDAGFSKDIIDRLDPDFVRYMGVTHKHEKAFPVEEPGIAERLKEPSAKTMILDALANKNVQRSMKWAGLVIGCVTGGIVVKAGMTGAKFLVGKLAENEKVQGFCKKLEDRAINFVSSTMNIDEDKVRKNVNEAKGVAERLSNNKWVVLGGAAATVAVAFALGHIDLVHEAAQSVASHVSAGAGYIADGFTGHDHTALLEAIDNARNHGMLPTEGQATVAAPVPPVDAIPEPVAVTPATSSFANYPGVDPAAGAQSAATSGSFANATPPVVDTGSAYASYPGVDPAAGAQSAAKHGSFASPPAPVEVVSPAVTTPAPVEVAASPANVTPPVLESGAAAPAAAINEHIDHAEIDKFRASAGQEFSAERSGLTNTHGAEVKFPTDSANLGINSGTGPVVADSGVKVNASIPDVSSPAPSVADATATVSGGANAPVTHTVVKNDTLSGIALKELQARGGHFTTSDVYKLTDQIYAANKDVIGNDINRIFPGQVLKLDGLGLGLDHGTAHSAAHSVAKGVGKGVAATVEVAANRETIPFAPDVLHDFVKDTKLDAVTLDGVGKVAFPVPAPNFAHVGTEGVATTKDINAALADFYTVDAKKVTEAVKVDKLDKFASLYDGHGKH
jgi:nucleoid-associated protein YgaU